MVDPHVHLRDWNQNDKETIYHGLSLYSSLSFDTIFDMPNTSPAITNRENALKRLRDADSAIHRLDRDIFYSIYLGLTSDSEQIKDMVDLYYSLYPRVCGLKMFCSQSTGNMGIVTLAEQEKVYSTLISTGYDGVLALHAEKEALFNKEATLHEDKRPPESESESIKDQIKLLEELGFKGKVHICHVSTKKGLEEITEAKKRNIIKITAGVTPHHALLSREEGNKYSTMNPPLRREEDRAYIFSSLLNGVVDIVESDHAPHTLLDKERGASGIPGIEGMILLIERLRENNISEELLNALFGRNALTLFGIKRETKRVPYFTPEEKTLSHFSYPYSAWF